MQIEINEEQIEYLKGLDSKKKQRKFLLDCLVDSIICESVKINSTKISDLPHKILCEIKSIEIVSREKPKGIELNKEYLQETLDKTDDLSLCQSLKNICVEFQEYEFASKWKQKEKDILDTYSREKLYELVQNGIIQMSDMVWAEKRKMTNSPSKK
jgi:hypothetical protein